MMAERATMLEEQHSDDAASGGDSDKVLLATRFGDMEFDRAQAIRLPRGIPGFPGKNAFGLAALPQPHMRQFSLLQSLDDADLSFLIMPMDVDNGAIARTEIESAADALKIARDDLAVVLIVAIRDVGGRAEVSVNLRAPILLDTRNRTGAQCVLSNSKYPVRHVISGGAAASGA